MSRTARDLATGPHNSSLEANNTHGESVMQRLRLGKLPRVAIVGAGVSGLRCADVLTRAGAQVTIFEARNRIGGRVHQVDNGGYLVDTGSNWIHGTKGNPIMELAERTGTAVMEPVERSVIFDREGRQRSGAESVALSAEFWSMIIQAFEYSDGNSDKISSDANLFDWLQEQWAEKYAKKPNQVEDLLEESRMWGQMVGSPITLQSLKYFWFEQGLDGGNVFVASTYKKILAEIAKSALCKAKLHLNTPVNQISYRTSDDQSPVTISTSGGNTHEFDEVVVTCPLGWLKKHASTTFTPELPERLAQAIDNIGYGALEKLYITFPSAFWLTNDDKASFPGLITWHTPKYHPDPASETLRTWNQSGVALSHLPGSSAQPTLLFYMHGDCGAYITNKVREHEPHSKTYNALLTAFAEPFYSRLPNYQAYSSVCTPTSFYLTSWQTDEYAGHGSYSTFRVGLEEGDKDIETMRNAGGLSEKGHGLWMAGEHTAPFVALGTTTGAYWSGEGVARRLAKQYGLTIDETQLDVPMSEVSADAPAANVAVDESNLGKNLSSAATRQSTTQEVANGKA